MSNNFSTTGYSTIDSAIAYIETARDEAEWIEENPEENFANEAVNIIYQLEKAVSKIESVRDANSELRDWGNEEFERADNAEQERDEYLDENNYLREQLEEANNRIAELENELNEKL